MDWDRLITIEQMEEATNTLLETGKKVGADSWQQRVKNQTPRRLRAASAAATFTVSSAVTTCASPPAAQQRTPTMAVRSATPCIRQKRAVHIRSRTPKS